MTVPLLVNKVKYKNNNDADLDKPAKESLSTILCILITCTLPSVVLMGIWFLSDNHTKVNCDINFNEPLHHVNEEFLSIALDTAVIREGKIRDQLGSIVLQQRSALLGPAYLRVGGTAADCLLFDSSDKQIYFQNGSLSNIDGGSCSYEEGLYCEEKPAEFFMSGDDWKVINQFTNITGLKLLFDLNVLLRNGSRWNSTNARELIEFSNRNGFDVVWQLGNEPNSFHHVFQTTVSGRQLAEDFMSLRKLLDSFPRYASSQLVGPDVTRPKNLQDESIEYLTEFLSNLENHTLSAITWHQYYLNGHTATAKDFTLMKNFNILQKQIQAIKDAVDIYFPGTPIWLSETSSAYGGGAPGLSDRFLASFLWLDKLGTAARMGIDVVIRQSLFHGHYALLESSSYEPLPDWWVSVLFKTFVGRTVLSTGPDLPQGLVRLYCHCTQPNSLSSSTASVTIYGLNLKTTTINIHPLDFPKHPGVTAYISAYILTAEDGLESKSVLLNGRKLVLNPDGTLPKFIPVHSNVTAPLVMPPSSIGFWVVHGINIPACNL